MFAFTSVIYLFNDIWVGLWSINYFEHDSKGMYLIVFIFTAVFLWLYILLRDIIYMKFLSTISNKVYLNSVDNVVNAEMEWHNNVSMDNVIYRLTIDVSVLDDVIKNDFMKIFEAVSQLIVGTIILNIYLAGYYLIITVVNIYVMYKLMHQFI